MARKRSTQQSMDFGSMGAPQGSLFGRPREVPVHQRVRDLSDRIRFVVPGDARCGGFRREAAALVRAARREGPVTLREARGMAAAVQDACPIHRGRDSNRTEHLYPPRR